VPGKTWGNRKSIVGSRLSHVPHAKSLRVQKQRVFSLIQRRHLPTQVKQGWLKRSPQQFFAKKGSGESLRLLVTRLQHKSLPKLQGRKGGGGGSIFSRPSRSFFRGFAKQRRAEPIRKPLIWSSTKDKARVRNALDHFYKHRKEFPEFHNAKQYVDAAHRIINNPPAGTRVRKRSSNGDMVYYNRKANVLVIARKDGTPKTMHRPDPKKHGLRNNMLYFYYTSR